MDKSCPSQVTATVEESRRFEAVKKKQPGTAKKIGDAGQ
jgi:hypothetical protein